MPDESALEVQPGVAQPPSINANFTRRASRRDRTASELVAGVLAGDRVALSQAITLVESQRSADRDLADRVLAECLPHAVDSIRVGITGVPGVGKSTFIEAVGGLIVEEGRRVCVLAVDPSSQVSGGSILGDKSRMTRLSANPGAYVRPSPSRGSLGGVTRHTREAISLCEAAGFDVVLVETVGVGQSESAVHSMVDCFLLLMLAGAGDELQGIKRGIMEMADVVAITKADGENEAAATRARAEYQSALRLFPPTPSGWIPPVLTCSSKNNQGIEDVWLTVREYIELVRGKGLFEARRAQQAVAWMREGIREGLFERFMEREGVRDRIARAEIEVAAGRKTPGRAVDEILEREGES